MLYEVCNWLRNWFDRARYVGQFVIENGELRLTYDDGQNFCPVNVVDGQYIRIINSALNDGVYRYPALLEDEEFDGGVWVMSPPKAFLAIVDEISAWCKTNGGADAQVNSPYTSESFGGYSYSKAGSGDSANGGGGTSWKDIFGSRLWQWRKL